MRKSTNSSQNCENNAIGQRTQRKMKMEKKNKHRVERKFKKK